MAGVNPATILQPLSAQDAPATLRVEGLSVGYGPRRALRDVTFDVRPGSIVAVLGGNGAGKSTLLRAVSGTLPSLGGRVTAGRIEFDGRRWTASRRRVVRAGVVQVPEGRQVFARPDRRGEPARRRPGAPGGRARRPRRSSGCSSCSPPARARRPARRAAVRRRAADAGDRPGADGRAPVLLLDEPSLGLAPLMVERIAEIIRRDQRRRARRSCWSSRTRRWRCGWPTAPTCWRSGRSPSTAPPPSSRPATRCAAATWASGRGRRRPARAGAAARRRTAAGRASSSSRA